MLLQNGTGPNLCEDRGGAREIVVDVGKRDEPSSKPDPHIAQAGWPARQALSFDQFVAASLRRARLELTLAICELDFIGVSLKQQIISGETAVALIHDAGLSAFVFGTEVAP